MAQFDIHPGPKGDGPTYLVDLQADLLGDIATTVVAPLYPIDAVAHRLARRLNPIFEIKGRKFAMMAAQLAAIQRVVLGQKLGSLADQRDDIVAALDFLFTGI